MQPRIPVFGFALILVGTIWIGWIHGQLTDRWGTRPNVNEAATRLRQPIPKEIGAWRLLQETQFQPEIVEMLQCPAHINCVYEHQQSGDIATVAVIVGPPGPVAVHTPEICYSSRDFAIQGERRAISVKDTDQQTHSLWELSLKSRMPSGDALRVVYAWSPGGNWEASSHPRFAYGGLPYLYKLQVSVTTNDKSGPSEFDPCQDFLGNFLSQLQSHLVGAASVAQNAR
jgi:uncharacterized protein DUF3485